MPINIKVKGNEGTDEYKTAQYLKEIIENSIPDNVTGDILLQTNCLLYGCKTKDIDLIVIGKLNNYKLRLDSKVYRMSDKQEERSVSRDISIDNFVFAIETKGHRAEDVKLDGNIITVKYEGKWHDATSQSEGQKYSLLEYFSRCIPTGKSPYICNFIWFTGIGQNNLRNLEEGFYHNYLPSEFNLSYLFQLACIQKIPLQWNNGSNHFSSFTKDNKSELDNLDLISNYFNLFEKNKEMCGDISRKKLETISAKLLKNQKYAEAIGEKLVIISGRAGTGKTLKLLNIAFDLALYKGKRCLILTYNNALVSDIKRLLALSNIADGITTNTVNIMTLHTYFMELNFGLGISGKKNFINEYENNIKQMKNYIEQGLVTVEDIQDLMKKRHDLVAWDYLMIDESQDWSYSERDILYKIFGYKCVVIADGIDQLIRRTEKCDWDKDLSKSEVQRPPAEKLSLRQKTNLVTFLNEYSESLGLSWSIDPKKELLGGKIIISVQPYNENLHRKEYNYCKQSGNIAYDYMFLVPPSLVTRDYINSERTNRKFSLLDQYNEMGIKIWDGTDVDLRTVYPVDPEQHRLFQYDSCRGLEGWSIVCLNFDEFIDYKFTQYNDENAESQLTLDTESERRSKFANIWSLMPLTRAIDTIIITLKDRNSKHAKIFYELYRKHPDFIEYID